MPKDSNREPDRISQLVHDVRTPLTVIQMLVYTLQQALAAEDKRPKDIMIKDLDMIKEETNKIETLMNEYRKEINS
jgi:signal transduction histidine kinase